MTRRGQLVVAVLAACLMASTAFAQGGGASTTGSINGRVADNTTPDNFLTLREAIALVNGTIGRALTPGEQAQVSGTLGANDVIQFSLPAGAQTIDGTGKFVIPGIIDPHSHMMSDATNEGTLSVTSMAL